MGRERGGLVLVMLTAFAVGGACERSVPYCDSDGECPRASYCDLRRRVCVGPILDSGVDGGVGDAGFDAGHAACSTSSECGGGTCDAGTCVCTPGYHTCGATCLPDDSVDSCGTSCAPCKVVERGTVSCDVDAGACSYTCQPSYFRCDAGCCTAAAIAAGGTHVCAILNNGAVKCWGRNDEGQLGNGSTTGSSVPVETQLTEPAVAITSGEFHTCAIVLGGAVRCWGDGAAVPRPVPGLDAGVRFVEAGSRHTCAITEFGGLKCWGIND
ncbi:MAG: RCC1 domain-containing protein, partial [Myxococcota bacterium]